MLIHQNLQSIGNSVEKIENFLYEHPECHFICTTEHWKSEEELMQIGISDFNLASYFCREHGKHGGPTKAAGGKLEMLSNVKNQIEGIGGWLGSSIPKLRKNETEGLTDEEPVAVEKTTFPGDISAPKDDDDNSR
nr:unnamed protein product [Callosobruchus analis]